MPHSCQYQVTMNVVCKVETVLVVGDFVVVFVWVVDILFVLTVV